MFNEQDYAVAYIDVEYGIIELVNKYTREKIYIPMPDGDELEAYAMNILALMRRAYDVGVKQERKRSFSVVERAQSGCNLRPVATPAGDNQEPNHQDT